ASHGVMRPSGFHADEARAADRAAAEVHGMPLVGHAVLGGVLAHRGDEDAVRKRGAAYRERREEFRHGIILAWKTCSPFVQESAPRTVSAVRDWTPGRSKSSPARRAVRRAWASPASTA